MALVILSFHECVAGTGLVGLDAWNSPDTSDDLPEVASSFVPVLKTSSTLEGVPGEGIKGIFKRSGRRRLPEKVSSTRFLLCFLSPVCGLGGVFSLSSATTLEGRRLIGAIIGATGLKTVNRRRCNYVNLSIDHTV
jgi:hypothetical protein